MDLLRKLRTTSRAKVTEDEIAFYEAVLKKSGSTVFEISKHAGFSKDRGYSLFESLFLRKKRRIKIRLRPCFSAVFCIF